MKRNKDNVLVGHIRKHYFDLMEDLVTLANLSDYQNNKGKRRSILFDFLQIGELVNQLSKDFLGDFGNADCYKLVAMRNRVVHGYSTVDDGIIFSTLKKDFQVLVEGLISFAETRHHLFLSSLVGKTIVAERCAETTVFEDERCACSVAYAPDIFDAYGSFQKVLIVEKDNSVSEREFMILGKVISQDNRDPLLVVSAADTAVSLRDDKNLYDSLQIFGFSQVD